LLKNENMKIKDKITISITPEQATTLAGFISGGIGTSDDDTFNKHMKPVLKSIDAAVNKYYKGKPKFTKPSVAPTIIYL
jgi:hypothetical protein